MRARDESVIIATTLDHCHDQLHSRRPSVVAGGGQETRAQLRLNAKRNDDWVYHRNRPTTCAPFLNFSGLVIGGDNVSQTLAKGVSEKATRANADPFLL